jgi:hypothetical protein
MLNLFQHRTCKAAAILDTHPVGFRNKFGIIMQNIFTAFQPTNTTLNQLNINFIP